MTAWLIYYPEERVEVNVPLQAISYLELNDSIYNFHNAILLY